MECHFPKARDLTKYELGYRGVRCQPNC